MHRIHQERSVLKGWDHLADLTTDDYLELSVDIDLADNFDQEVLAPLRAACVDAEIPPQGGGIPMETYTAVIQLAGASAQFLLLIAQSVAAWQKRRQQHQLPKQQQGQTEVWRIRRIERRGHPPLEGAQVTEEVEIFHYINGGSDQ